MNIELLKESGIDYDNGLKRFLDDEAFYEHVLIAFLDDTSLERAIKAFSDKNFKQLFDCAHEVKGTSGNLDMKELYSSACELVEELRGGIYNENNIAPKFEKFRNCYLAVREAIIRAKG